ncbi:hypothetical protein CDA63_08850 [Hymenobacter amundsenii]|uniref:Uncharacterized protein n=1 Tax=Hymenobacter amundsenii TaxID=2006685 RepID=A0A246FL47_9BACT|nr:hypothetical protein [Hymenobacter amundsenii]OWP63475.1 hypothetical protein CDA63_08850 [Hymenobacter amundsenii]
MLSRIILTGLLAGGPFLASAQLTTEPARPLAARALAARDSLLKMAAATRFELAEQTWVDLQTPNRTRRHIIRGYAANAKQTDSDGRKKTLIWQHRTIYRRNGRIQEKYTAYLNNRTILEERWLNGSELWIRLRRPQDLKLAAPLSPAVFNGTYARGGYINWNGKNYLLPEALHVQQVR